MTTLSLYIFHPLESLGLINHHRYQPIFLILLTTDPHRAYWVKDSRDPLSYSAEEMRHSVCRLARFTPPLIPLPPPRILSRKGRCSIYDEV